MSPNGEARLMAIAGRAALGILIAILAYLAVELRADDKDHEARLTKVEVDIGYIKDGIKRIEEAVKR